MKIYEARDVDDWSEVVDIANDIWKFWNFGIRKAN
jgi:hypothetical protein